jgi:hypothetical protein
MGATRQAMAKYDSDGGGSLGLAEFAALVEDIRAFQVGQNRRMVLIFSGGWTGESSFPWPCLLLPPAPGTAVRWAGENKTYTAPALLCSGPGASPLPSRAIPRLIRYVLMPALLNGLPRPQQKTLDSLCA